MCAGDVIISRILGFPANNTRRNTRIASHHLHLHFNITPKACQYSVTTADIPSEQVYSLHTSSFPCKLSSLIQMFIVCSISQPSPPSLHPQPQPKKHEAITHPTSLVHVSLSPHTLDRFNSRSYHSFLSVVTVHVLSLTVEPALTEHPQSQDICSMSLSD